MWLLIDARLISFAVSATSKYIRIDCPIHVSQLAGYRVDIDP
jgi:hypothetical protein